MLRHDAPLSSKPSVKAGGEITRGKYGGGSGGRGTAGLIVRTKGASTGALVLTCAHVLGTEAILGGANENAVYSPRYREWSEIACNRPFGTVVIETLQKSPTQVLNGFRVVQKFLKIGKETFAVDAALIQVAADAAASNEIPKIGAIAGVRDLVQEWNLGASEQPPTVELLPARQLPVKKFGSTTGYTEGTIKRLVRQTVREVGPGPNVVENQSLVLEIEANAGQKPFTAEYELDMMRFKTVSEITSPDEVVALFANTKVTATKGGSATKPTLKIVGHTFSQPGDSGSPIVDNDGKIVGILRSGSFVNIFVKDKPDPVEIDTGNSQAVLIVAALDKLDVAFLPAGQQNSGARVIVPGMPVERGHAGSVDWDAVDELLHSVGRISPRPWIVELGRQHFGEIRDLIHHRRRVTLTWHRAMGPRFLASFLRSAGRGTPIANEISGVRLRDAVRAMSAVLAAEGSFALRTAVRERESELLALAEGLTSSGDLLAAFGARWEATV